MKIKSVLSSLVLGAAILTLSACDSGGPSVEDIKISDVDLSDSIKVSKVDIPEIEPIDIPTFEYEPINIEL